MPVMITREVSLRPLCFALLCSARAGVTQTVISVELSCLDGSPNQSTKVNIDIFRRADLYVFQFDERIAATSPMTEADFVGPLGTTTFVPGTIDNSAAVI